MRKLVIGIVVVAAMLLVGTPRARANSQTISINEPCDFGFTCLFDTGDFGSSASGSAVFTPKLPFTFGFSTDPATTFCDPSTEPPCDVGYIATFDSGVFTMTGPAGLTFGGEVTSGSAEFFPNSGFTSVEVSYSGQWSDGLPSSGTASVFFEEFPLTGTFATLTGTVPVVPEPSTLLLFGSGLLLFGIIVHRKQLQARGGLIDVAEAACS